MFKCDKCGCEHNSRTVCPKCGAPVVIVNEDYLLRRQQWEELQKNNLRYRKKGEDRGSSDIGRHNDSDRKRRMIVCRLRAGRRISRTESLDLRTVFFQSFAIKGRQMMKSAGSVRRKGTPMS